MDSLDISFFIELARQENGIRSGYDKITGRWRPHKSIEGGNDTIAYGHKLLDNEDFSDGIDDFDAVDLLVRDFNKSWELTQDQWDDNFHERFAKLPQKYKYVLTELAFNSGPLATGGRWKWPKLALAIRNNDDQNVYNESIRYFHNKNNKKQPLLSRSTAICRALGLIFEPLKI